MSLRRCASAYHLVCHCRAALFPAKLAVLAIEYRLCPYWLLTITSLLAIQFNRSRLAYIAGLLLLYYSVVNQQWLTDNTLALYQDVW